MKLFQLYEKLLLANSSDSKFYFNIKRSLGCFAMAILLHTAASILGKSGKREREREKAVFPEQEKSGTGKRNFPETGKTGNGKKKFFPLREKTGTGKRNFSRIGNGKDHFPVPVHAYYRP